MCNPRIYYEKYSQIAKKPLKQPFFWRKGQFGLGCFRLIFDGNLIWFLVKFADLWSKVEERQNLAVEPLFCLSPIKRTRVERRVMDGYAFLHFGWETLLSRTTWPCKNQRTLFLMVSGLARRPGAAVLPKMSSGPVLPRQAAEVAPVVSSGARWWSRSSRRKF